MLHTLRNRLFSDEGETVKINIKWKNGYTRSNRLMWNVSRQVMQNSE